MSRIEKRLIFLQLVIMFETAVFSISLSSKNGGTLAEQSTPSSGTGTTLEEGESLYKFVRSVFDFEDQLINEYELLQLDNMTEAIRQKADYRRKLANLSQFMNNLFDIIDLLPISTNLKQSISMRTLFTFI